MRILFLILPMVWVIGCSDTPKVDKHTTTVHEYGQPEKTTTTTVETRTE